MFGTGAGGLHLVRLDGRSVGYDWDDYSKLLDSATER